MKTTATEVVIALQFREALSHLNALQIAALVEGFKQFPNFSELPPAGPMPYTLGQLDGTEAVANFDPSFPRIVLTSDDREYVLSFQGDRLTYSWVRLAEVGAEANYPGFETLAANLIPIAEQFRALTGSLFGVDIVFSVAEVTYVNVIPTRKTDGGRILLSQIYSFLAQVEGAPGINGYFYGWNEQLSVAEGVLRLQVNGPVIYAPEKPGSSFTLAAAFLLADDNGLYDQLLAVRRRIGETYSRVLRSK